MASIVHFFALANRHADPVALDQPPALVGDGVGGLAGVERGVDHAREILQLGPEHLPGRKMPQLVAFQEIAGQFAHLREEPEIALLRGRPGIGSLENFDQAKGLDVGFQQAEQQEEFRRVRHRGFVADLDQIARPGVRRNHHPFAASKHFVEQPAVLGLLLLVVAKVRVLDIDLVLEGQPAFGIDRPDGAADGREGRNHARQELPIKLFRGDVLLRQLRNFRHQRADLLFRLFDL